MNPRLKSTWHKLDAAKRMHGLSTPIIGLTGGIASGKSTVADILVKKGFCIISADALVKKIYQKPESIAFIAKDYPETMSGPGIIDFKKLRKKFFDNPNVQQKIEQYIYARMKDAFIEELNAAKNPNLVVYDVPLLFEKKLDKLVDVTICVYCPKSQQISRLTARDGIDVKMAESILATQMEIEQKRTQCDFVIENTSTLELVGKNTDKILEKLIE